MAEDRIVTKITTATTKFSGVVQTTKNIKMPFSAVDSKAN